MRRKTKGDVSWYGFSKSKTPIVYSTVASKDLIKVLCEQNPAATILEIQEMIHYDVEAKQVLQAYIDKGYGGRILKVK